MLISWWARRRGTTGVDHCGIPRNRDATRPRLPETAAAALREEWDRLWDLPMAFPPRRMEAAGLRRAKMPPLRAKIRGFDKSLVRWPTSGPPAVRHASCCRARAGAGAAGIVDRHHGRTDDRSSTASATSRCRARSTCATCGVTGCARRPLHAQLAAGYLPHQRDGLALVPHGRRARDRRRAAVHHRHRRRAPAAVAAARRPLHAHQRPAAHLRGRRGGRRHRPRRVDRRRDHGAARGELSVRGPRTPRERPTACNCATPAGRPRCPGWRRPTARSTPVCTSPGTTSSCRPATR